MENTQLTDEQALESYGDVELRFSSYYKYSFSFEGVADDGTAISATVGGNADDIYRYNVGRDSTITLNNGEHYAASAHQGGKSIWDYYDY